MTITPAMVNNVPIGFAVFSSSCPPPPGNCAVWGEFDNFSFTPPTATVPHVVRMTLTNAEAAIRAAKLAVGTVSHSPSTTVPAGDVISQHPVGGTVVSEGTAVNLVASCGLPTTVPNVVHLPELTAKAHITSAHLVVGTISKAHSTVPAGDVISESPKAGIVVCKGTAVGLLISLGP
jgi:beta-lactam-binding protein with PASTA domain